ncbi:MAG: hypothetical protein OXP73_07690 [Chloroflexota bacterium]|nr:hypothetical protein [Chloroflexota bacterium]
MRAYRSNRRRALATSVLIILSVVLYGSSVVVLGLRHAALGAALASRGVEAYGSMARSMRPWDEVPAAVGAFGGLSMAMAGIAFLFWFARSTAILDALLVPDDQRPWGCAAAPLFLTFPVMVVAFFVVLQAFPYSTVSQITLFTAAAVSLAIPVTLIRRQWVASSMPGASGSTPPVWGGVSVWWAAYLAAWIATGLASAMIPERWNSTDEAVVDLLAVALLEIASGVALAVAAAMMIRIMFRINAMQDALARTLPQPRPRRERGAVAPTRRAATQWRCESCDVMNPTTMRFCQNCARERR